MLLVSHHKGIVVPADRLGLLRHTDVQGEESHGTRGQCRTGFPGEQEDPAVGQQRQPAPVGTHVRCRRVAEEAVCLPAELEASDGLEVLDPSSVRVEAIELRSRDKAGAYGVQGLGSGFVTRLEGSYTNVVGLPAAEVVGLLLEHGALDQWP